jgi:mRNA-degrading endonuclease RelE of RelBE toxin-antitoxin system
MEIIKTNDFSKSYSRLPQDIKHLYSAQKKRFVMNWRDPRLHIKKIKTLTYAFSFRITRRYRVFFYFQTPQTAIFFDVDHRKDIYR